MKKVISMITLAAICLGTVSAAIPVKSSMQDTTVKKMKMKKKMVHHKMKTKMKKKMMDTTKKM
jgi:hypothetical protein